MTPILLETWKALAASAQTAPDVQLYKGYVADDMQILEAARQIRFVVSTGHVDRDGDTIAVEGWELGEFRNTPVVQWMHHGAGLPVARVTEIGTTDGRLTSVAAFPAAEGSPWGDTVYRLLMAGSLPATAIGFRPLEWVWNEERHGVDFQRQLLVAFFVGVIPANPRFA